MARGKQPTKKIDPAAFDSAGAQVFDNSLRTEIEDSYLEYAYSVIHSRALPDARDGLKPVHRRILYSMHEQGHTPDKKYVKSARVVGDVIGKYHPHGDQSIYDAMVRMAQDFSMRVPLIDGQGNFGSVDGDAAAATSRRLCDGISVARPTAMPEAPLSSTNGRRPGKSRGSSNSPS